MDLTTQQLTRQHVSDSRLLQNLYKSEKGYVDHLSAAVASALAASSALSSWGTSEPADVSSAATEIAEGLASVAHAQRIHVQAIEGYRAALKDVLDREQNIRNIVRDRDILVKRLIKADQKRARSVGADPAKEAERYQKHLYAQRELAACEDALQAEENALIGVKRRTFKEALTMRMKTMGDAGAAMVDAAKDAIILLDSFDTNGQLPTPPDLPSRPDEESNGWEYAEQPYDVDGHTHSAEPSFNNIENASVTPSQSASQINYGASRPNARPARYAGGNFNDIGEASNGHEHTEQHNTYDDETNAAAAAEHSEADSDRDYQDAFTTDNHTAHRNAPPQAHNLPEPPAPTPPVKEERPSSRLGGGSPQVSMPPVPSAPSLRVGGPDLGPIPTASRVYIRGQDSSSEDEDDHPAGQQQGTSVRSPSRSGWTSHISAGGHRRQESGDSGVGSRPTPSRSGSFFGRVGRLFKTDLKNTVPPLPSPTKKQGAGSTTGSQQQHSQASERPSSRIGAPSNALGRRISLLRSAAGPDSSDEEDDRELVRHVNPRQPLWQAPGKASSDIGTKGKLSSLPPAARVVPGPLSARQQAEKQSEAASAAQTRPGRPVSMYETVATSQQHDQQQPKKKKKKAGSTRRASSAFETGSEVGTGPTRAAGYEPGVAPTSVGINTSRGTLDRQGSVRSVGGSTLGKKKKASKPGVTALNAFSPGQSAGKYSTASWVARPGGGAALDPRANPIAQAVANAGVVPKADPPSSAGRESGRSTPVPATPSRQTSVRSKAPIPSNPLNTPSALKSSPLKPALKNSGTMARSLSQTTEASAGYQDLPQLGAPIKAPPPIALQDSSAISDSLTLPSSQLAASKDAESAAPASAPSSTKKAKPSALLKLAADEGFDGSGRLGVPGTSPLPSPSRKQAQDADSADASTKKQPERAQSPQIAMPKSEPFRLDLSGLSGSGLPQSGTAATGRASMETDGMTPATDREFLTPNEQEAYQLFLSAPEEAQPEVSHERKTVSTIIEEPAERSADGVTRVTERRVRLTPSRTYSSEKAPRLSTASSDTSESAPSIPEVDFSDSLYDDVQAAGLKGYSAAPALGTVAAEDPVLRNLHLPALANVAKSDTSESGVSRRKSVRMASDVKLPPETPTSEAAETPRGNHASSNGKEYPFGTSAGGRTAALPQPMRIAPPPAAPARVSEKDEGPIDLAQRERPSWNTRIGAANDSSSDSDGDGYASARKAFRSATRHLGAATGTTPKSKSKSTADAGAPSSKGKKKKATAGFSVETVGRSPSTRR
ncbi:hypothetical protein V8E36_003366 [Tilletia maclaganii]